MSSSSVQNVSGGPQLHVKARKRQGRHRKIKSRQQHELFLLVVLMLGSVVLLQFSAGFISTLHVESFTTTLRHQQQHRCSSNHQKQPHQLSSTFMKRSTTTAQTVNNKNHVNSAMFASSSTVSSNLDPVTYLRTEFVSAALFTNQTPRTADVCVQLGTYDGRAVTFIPKTIRQFIPSSLKQDGKLDLKIQRAIKQSADRREMSDIKILYCANRRADDLNDVEDNSVDVVISMQSATKMIEEGLDWKKSVQEAGRVLKPGTGRFLFVEQTQMENDEYYLDYVMNLACPPPATTKASSSTATNSKKKKNDDDEDDNKDDDDEERYPLFELIGYDDVDLVIKPHVAGVVLKRNDAGLTKRERIQLEKQQEEELYAERSLQAFEKRKKGKKKKNKKKNQQDDDESASS